jgi:hypothetical protein
MCGIVGCRPSASLRGYIRQLARQRQAKVKMLDALEMGGIASAHFQSLRESDGGDHRVGYADGLPGAHQFTFDPSRQFCGVLIENQHFFARRGGQEFINRRMLWFCWKPRTISMTVITDAVKTPFACRLATAFCVTVGLMALITSEFYRM